MAGNRITIFVPDEFYEWFTTYAKEQGLSNSACASMMLNSYKRSLENQSMLQTMVKVMAQLPPEEWTKQVKEMQDELGKPSL